MKAADEAMYKQEIACIEEQERQLTFSAFDNDLAWRVGSALRDTFVQRYDTQQNGIVISIALFSGHILFQCAVGDSRKLGPDNWDWVRRKTNTVKRFSHASYLVGRQRLLKGKDLDGLGPDYAAHGGAFPINITSCTAAPVGVIVVSGLTQEEDHDLIVTTLESVLQSAAT